MKFARLSYLLVAGAAGLAATVVPAASSTALAVGRSAGPEFVRVSSPPRLPQHTAALGPVAGRTVLHLDVMLNVPDQPALTAFIAGLSDRSSPLFHRYLRPGQFGARFGATSAQVAGVDAALRAEGLTPGPVSSSRLSIPVTATVAAADRAFAISVDRYRLPGGRVAYSNAQAPRVAGSVASFVLGVLGLSSVNRPQSLQAVPKSPGKPAGIVSRLRPVAARAAGPQPCTAAVNAGPENFAYTANQLAAYYAMTPLYGLGDLGKGVRVAIAEFEPNLTSDISAYESCYKLSTAVSYVKVDGGVGSGAGSGEAALDIEDVMGLAPDVAIDVYQAPNGGDTDTYDLYNAIVKADTDKVITTSWGLCELDADTTEMAAENTVFEQAATQGQTVFAAAGDFGSTACYSDGSANGAIPSVSDPASQPDVIGVGGTTIGSTETVWNDSSVETGAGGGGISEFECMPSYQDQPAIPGLINSDSMVNGSCPTGYWREVPDVAADADPYTGYVIYYDRAWTGIGGTSAAAPLWAAVAALIDASPFCADYGSGDAGVQPAGLYSTVANDQAYIYAAAPEALYDVTSGENDYTPAGYTGGLYPATTGYDMASGLGTPLVTGLTSSFKTSEFYPGLAALMCWTYGTRLRTTAVTKISPAAGPVRKAQTITLTGKGFLPIAGADIAVVGTKDITASCSSTTKCTVRLPAESAASVPVRIKVEDLTESTVTAADHFSFVAAPKVSSLSPTHGGTGGGTKVTIRGSNFIGVTAIYFGSKKGTKIKVISATKLTVVVPAGSGTVSVTVHAAGGTSKVVGASHFRY